MNNNYFTFKNSRMLQQLICSSFFYGKIKIIKNSLLILIILLLTTTKGFSQCSYPGTAKVGTDYTFCIDKTTGYTTDKVNAGQYVVVNVVRGFEYTFSVGNVFSDNENITLFNAVDNSNNGLGVTSYNSSASGASVTWTATFSGKVKVLLSRGTCVNDNTSGGTLTLQLNSIGNTQDSQTSFGTDQWIGHVYNWTGNPPPGGVSSPITPASATYPFTTANYVGSYAIVSDVINENFGGQTACFAVTSAATNIYTETFAVRYRMNFTKSGCYLLNVSGDDGVRVYVDNVLVLDKWKEQGETNYCNNLIYLSGNNNIVLDYYENGGQNIVKFSLTKFDPTTNTIAGGPRNVCSGVSPGVLDGSSYSCGTNSVSGASFQWQASTDNINFTDISGATTEDYTPTTVTTLTTDVRYFRRIFKSIALNAGTCQFYSNVITVNTSASTALTISSDISGATNYCLPAADQPYSITAVTNALNYTWTVPTGWTITSGQGTNSIIVSTGTTGQNGNISVTASNGCTTSVAKSLAVTVGGPSITTQPTAAGVCVSSSIQSTSLSYSAVTGTPTKYSIVWDASPTNTFVPVTDAVLPTGATGVVVISVPANTLAGTYTGTITVKNAAGCVSNGTKFNVTVNNNITTRVGDNPYRFCIDNSNTITTAVANSGQYVVLDVIKGFKYTFTVGNAFSGNEFLTVTDDADTTNTALVTNSGASGTSISNWISTLSGRIKIKLSTDNCTTGSTGLALSLMLNSLGNTKDSQADFGTDSWVGHVYNLAEATPPADAFNSANYVGYFKNPTENINEGFGGNTACFQVFSNGMNRVNIFTETFAVRYRMRSSKSGYYFLNVTGDDGVRIFVDGALVFNEWKVQAPTSYCNTLVYLNGNSDVIVEYFENSGQNELKVDLTPFPNGTSVNTVDGPAVRNVCTGVSPGTLTANDLLTGCGTTTLPRVSYQWQVSTDGMTFIDIATATSKDYLVPAQTSITNISRYYRRLVKQTGTATQPGLPSNVIQVNTNVNTYVSTNPNLCISIPIATNTVLATTTGATGIGTATGLPTGVTASWSANKITITGTPTVSRPFTYSIPLTGGCGNINATGTITVGADSTYKTATGWSAGLPNNNGLNAVIEGSYNTSSGNINACNCDVKSTGSLTISDGTTVTIQNNITNNGTLTVKDGGNLVQKNNAGINQGNIAVEKLFTFITPPAPIVHRQQYNYVISPVIGQVLKSIYDGNPSVLYHNESSNYFGTSTGAYIAGRGLALKEPSETAVSTSTVTAQFKGVPFNGVLEYPLAYTVSATSLYGYNLVGNPYPSNIDLQSLYAYTNGSDKNADKIQATFEFWDNRGNLQFTQQGSGYSGDSYAKYNVLSGTGVAPSSAATNAPDQARIPNQYVQIGTAFMVRALQSANGKKLVFNNTMRTDSKGKSYFGKQSEKDRYWLTLRTPSAIELMSAVVYFEGGSNDFGLEDSKASGGSDGIYSIVDDYKIAIQGRAAFAATDKVDLGLSLFSAGLYTISLLDTDGVFANGQNIYLKDKLTNIVTNLTHNSYSFTSNAGESTGRFEIIYEPETVLATDAQTTKELVVYKDQGDFVIKAQTKKITEVEVYDTGGRLIYTVQPNSTKAVIPAEQLVNSVYILKVNQSGQITSKKIIR